MSSHTLYFILGGCLIGAIQLIAGIALGMWIRRADSAATRRGHHDLMQASLIANRLKSLADEMTSIVGEHRSKLDQASHLLTSGHDTHDESLAELVVDVIGDVVRANQSLQSKLDIAENRLEEQAVEIESHISRSLTDPLTGLPNRREFNDRLEARMAAWNRRREAFSLLLLDVDHFKKLNDRYGHLAGDQVLAAIGRALRAAIRREDAVARYGGEEFAILLPATALSEAVLVAEKVREAVARVTVDSNNRQITMTVSGGLATIESNEEVESLIQRADSALYAAKAAGRNCTCIHNGIDCQLAGCKSGEAQPPVGTASRLVELIHSPDTQKSTTEEPQHPPTAGFAAYLPGETISAELAQTCQELRRYLEERGTQATPTLS